MSKNESSDYLIYLTDYISPVTGKANDSSFLIATARVSGKTVFINFDLSTNGASYFSFFEGHPEEVDRLKQAILSGATAFKMEGESTRDGVMNNAWQFLIKKDNKP